MSRATVAVDRVVLTLIALVLLGAGVGGILWWSGRLAVSDTVDLKSLAPVTHQPWWPWAVGALAVVLVLLGLRWLAAHLPDRGVSQLVLAGSDASGRLVVDASSAVAAAAHHLEQTPGVTGVRGLIQQDRGQLVARFNTSLDRRADLHLVAEAADEVTAQLRTVLQRDDVVGSVQLRVSRSDAPPPRVS